MITACEKCSAKHQLDMSSITKPTARYKCQNCGHVNVIENPEFADNDTAYDQDQSEIFDALAQISSDQNDVSEPSEEAEDKKDPEQLEPSAQVPVKKPKISGMSIKAKITLIIVFLVISALSVVGFISASRGTAALSVQAESHLNLITAQKANEYNNIFSRLQEEIEGLAIHASHTFGRNDITEDLGYKMLMPWTGSAYGSSELKISLAPEILKLQRIGFILQGLVQKNPYLELGYMATENNVFVADNQGVIDVIGAEKGFIPNKRSWYVGAVEKDQTVWTDPYIDVNTKKLVVSCATPVYLDNGTLVGVLGFDVLLDTIQKDIISLDIGYDSQAFLLGKKGQLLAKPGMSSKNKSWTQTVKTDNALETGNAEFKAIIKQMMMGTQGIGSHTEGGNRILIAYAPIPAINASVGIVVSENKVMQPAEEIKKIIMYIWIGAVVISIIIGLMIGNGITKPINDMAMRADLISQGQMDLEEIATSRKDEIGVLIEAFNRLVTSLKIAMTRQRR
ncbi:MAG: HAMP domain-containing protein [Desulfobacterales bacterium]|nr:HAMP domain-containing protein [Desulfobacterales bacterium]